MNAYGHFSLEFPHQIPNFIASPFLKGVEVRYIGHAPAERNERTDARLVQSHFRRLLHNGRRIAGRPTEEEEVVRMIGNPLALARALLCRSFNAAKALSPR